METIRIDTITRLEKDYQGNPNTDRDGNVVTKVDITDIAGFHYYYDQPIGDTFTNDWKEGQDVEVNISKPYTSKKGNTYYFINNPNKPKSTQPKESYDKQLLDIRRRLDELEAAVGLVENGSEVINEDREEIVGDEDLPF